MELGLGWLCAVAQGYNCSYNKSLLGINFQMNLMSLFNTIAVGLGWLRAVAQGYNYNCDTIKFG